ncbi:MAG: hypothetical protein ABIH79_02345 [archaeon]
MNFRKFSSVTFFLMLLIGVLSTGIVSASLDTLCVSEICDDQIDNDFDDQIDCADSDCGPCITVRADKVVCDSESDLPNWGSVAGVPAIISTTAADYVVANPDNCEIENWTFQWGRNAGNPGNNYEGITSGWTSFASGTLLPIYNADEGTLWFREEIDSAYFLFSGADDDDVTAEFYCDGDSFKYDNYDYMKSSEISNDVTLYCVGFNALSSCEERVGPVTSNLDVSKYSEICQIKIEAIETDSCSKVEEAEYFLGGAECDVGGTGIPLMARDGDFNSLIEDVIGTYIWVNDGSLNVHVRGKDIAGNWGECQTVQINLDCLPPFYPTCEEGDNDLGIALDGECNAYELLVCGNDTTLTASVCDDESAIQMAEYFIDEDHPLNWHGINMSAVDGTYLDERCEDVEAVIDTSNLAEGTHYVQMHSKDSQENWGKFEFSPIVPFIRDTTAPRTLKVLNPVDRDEVVCSGNEASETGETLTNGCYYVKQGTTIKLDARDFNPDNDADDIGLGAGYNNLVGEYAGDVVIHYVVYWKNESSDAWVVNQSGESAVDGSVTITLSEDSYHLIEYWATDGCENNMEFHHFELDIVDTAAPATTSEILGPRYYDDATDKMYVDGVTEIKLTCVDPEPHPVNDVITYYRYYVDDVMQGWIIYQDPFSFPEESHHILEYYCVDALNNVEVTHIEDYYVDHSKPTTSINYGIPLVNDSSDNSPKWITSNTEIGLSATDNYGYDHDSGVDFTKYRVTKMQSDTPCESAHSGCSEYSGSGEWSESSENVSFKIDETSCHMIEFYSVDMVNKTEEINKDCVFVDNQAPKTVKTVIGKKVLMDETCNSETEIWDYWITQNTEITLNCNDVLPHPVGDVTLFWRWGLDGSSPEWNEADGSMSLFPKEDCLHKLEWYCVDALGNSEGSADEPIVERDNVDTEPPVVNKWIQVRKSDEELFGGKIYSGEEHPNEVYVRSGDEIKFCADVYDIKETLDDGVGVDWVKFRLVDLLEDDNLDPKLIWDEIEQAYCARKIAKVGSHCGSLDGTLEDCGLWRYEVRAKDLLGNKGPWTNGIEILIDNVAPIGEVLNPHSGNYYRDGISFQIYAPAVDFGGDYCSLWGQEQNCPASGVDYCELYAIDYAFEDMDQDEIKNCYSDLWTYFMQIGEEPTIVYLGTVPYENGVCKGYARIPKEGEEGYEELTDTVFLGINYVDKAGNQGLEVFGHHLQLALNPWFSPITMNIDNEGPMVSITDSNLPGPVTSGGDGDNIFIEAEVIEYASGFDGCWAEIYYENGDELDDYVGVADIIGTEVEYNLCRINGAVPDGLESGNYLVKVNVRDELFNIGSVVIPMIVDNTRPTMSVVSPLEGEVYGALLPVSLNVGDSQSPIVDETVMFKISEIPAFGNAYCIFGNCEDSGWIRLTKQENGLYADTIDLNDYEVSGQGGRYVFDAVACDNLYVEELDTDLGFSLGNSRTDTHCRMISKHGQVFEEPRLECNDGIDNEDVGDGLIDYLKDTGCYSVEDDNEEAVCGNDYEEDGEECDDGNTEDGDGCSSDCIVVVEQEAN